MRIQINPTRMSLLKLRKRLIVARRGHKLLKDKLEGLLKEFMPLVEHYGDVRARVDRELPATCNLFKLAAATSGEGAVEAALDELEATSDITLSMKNIMGVLIPQLVLGSINVLCTYSTVLTTDEFDSAGVSLRRLFPVIIDLANLEETLLRLADEIEKTRRRVNALEYVLIPALTSTIKSIANKLEENDRADRARLMKIKDMLRMAE